MPSIIVRVPEGAFDTGARERLVRGITEASKQIEQIGDDTRHEALIWVIIEEIKAGHIFAGGHDPLPRVLPVIVQFFVPEGVMDAAARRKAASLFHAAAVEAKRESDPRRVMTSLIMSTVVDGTWGVSGTLWHLDDFVKAAGYKHLQDRVVVSA